MSRKDTLLKFLDDDKFPPVNIEDIMLMLDIPFDDREELSQILSELTAEGKIIKTAKRKYASVRKLGYIAGKFSLKERGFGFISDENEEYFVPSSATMDAMNGDTVLARITVKATDGKKNEAKIIKVIARGSDSIIGTFTTSRNFGFVVSDDAKLGYDIFISKKRFNGAKNGQKVIAKITKWPENGRKPEGEIIEVLGYPDDKGVDILSVIRRYGLETDFNEKVKAQCENINCKISDADIDARCDFRNESIITIDGADSRDFDDAVCVTLNDGIYTLGVHIADVTHYVTENSPLDKEAFRRGTSVYFPDRVVPMLPEMLSNGICSLNPHEDRLTLSVIMDINQNGEVINHRITEGIICSRERMTYDDVTAILSGDKQLKDKYSHIYEELQTMEKLAAILRKKRQSSGSIDFDFPETKVVLDENGKAADVYKYESGVSNKIIEEFMLIANKTVAEEFFWADIPFVYRVHEKPTREKIYDFNFLIKTLGYRSVSITEPHPGEFASILQKAKGTKEEMIISKFMLRSLMKAKYSEQCLGHFGLSFKYYCHFTSPIRRYPDLAIHRIIKEFLRSGISRKRYSYLKKFAAEAAVKSSEAEITAMEAEREADDIKKAEYMQKYIGKTYPAVISSITSFGFFAELENGIEGLVRMIDLTDDYYVFNGTDLSLIGEHTKKTYRIGDKTEITVAAANPHTKQIDFYLA